VVERADERTGHVAEPFVQTPTGAGNRGPLTVMGTSPDEAAELIAICAWSGMACVSAVTASSAAGANIRFREYLILLSSSSGIMKRGIW
jgi:hypothetical protein